MQRHLDDFDLRPGHESPGRLSPGDPGQATAEPDLRRHTRGRAFDEEERLDPPTFDAEPPAAPPRARRAARGFDDAPRSSNRTVGVVVTLIVAAAVLAGLWTMSRRVKPPAPNSAVREEASPAAPDVAGDDERRSKAELEAPLPPLDQSDALVRELVATLSSHPSLRGWLAAPGLIRTFAAAVENASLGGTPAPNLAFLRPREPYRVIERQGPDGPELVTDPASYRRYDAVTDVFVSIDPQSVADVYRRLHGLVQEAFADLGYPDESFDTTMATAFETLLDTPIPATAPALERSVGTYRYADPRLEALQPVQKQLLRMGPDHARRIQDQLRRLATAMKLPLD